jgi:4-hydroxy-2-oxoglutarate aldolase
MRAADAVNRTNLARMSEQLTRNAPDKRLLGVIGPLVTTFGSGGDALSLSEYRTNIRAHLRDGQQGVLVAGSTGEAALLDEDERSRLVSAAREEVPSDCVLLVGVGAESTVLTVRRARDAAARGASAVLVVSPHYYTASMTQAALRSHFARVADESPAPVLLYNIPKYAHLVIEPELVAELAQHPNVVGMKDSTGDMKLLERYVAVQKSVPRFTVLTGHGPTFATALKVGARGGILAVALFTGEITPRIFEAFLAGDEARAGELQATITTAAKDIVGTLGVPGVKAAMDVMGLHGGVVRSPLQALNEQGRQLVESLMRGVSEATRASLV